MYGVALMLTMATLGVDYGWQPGEDGQMEYIIQIEPELVDTLREGKVDLLSEIPPELQGVKRFRIRVGKGPVPRKGLDEARANGLLPSQETAANQQPKLPIGTKPGGNFPSNRNGNNNSPATDRGGTQPGANNPNDAPLPDERDRFTGTGSNPRDNAFPTVGTTPGINRGSTTKGGNFPNTQQNGDQLQPLPSAPTNSNQPGNNFNQGNTAPLNNGAYQQQQPDPNDRWTNGNPPGNRWASLDNPRGVGPELNPANGNFVNDPRNDPRYNNMNNGLPEVRRDNMQNPMYPNTNYGPPPYQGPVRPDQYAWNAGNQPLRDPEFSNYGPGSNYGPPPLQRPYDMANRQVDYREVASTRPPGSGNANTTQPPAASTTGTLPTTPTKATTNERIVDDPNNKPWLPLTFTAMLLFASVGLNFYLGWIANGLYMRYRALLMEMRNVRTTALA